MRFADHLFAGLHLQDADPQRRANDCREARAEGVEHATILPRSGYMFLAHPVLAQDQCIIGRFG